MRLIDADAAVERLQRRSDMFRFDKRYEAVMRDAIGEVLTMPTIDAVPVVRCKDCVDAIHSKKNEDGYVACSAFEYELKPYDGYCSFGEAKHGRGGEADG